MSDYRRLYIPGGTYFFTVVTYRRQPILADEQRIVLLRQAFREVKSKRPFDVLASVVLPDHLHCLWRLPEGDSDFSSRWQMIKTAFSRRISAPVQKDGSKPIWQPRFSEHGIRDETDFQQHADYIHFNPVKHGYVAKAADWPYSSFHRWVKCGFYTPDWAAEPADSEQSWE